MLQTLQSESITKIFTNHTSVLEKAKQGPVFLTQQSEPVAVIVTHDEWVRLAQRIALLELIQPQPPTRYAPDTNAIENKENHELSLSEPLCDRDRMQAALKSIPRLSDENALQMDKFIYEAREASIDYALLT